METLEVIRRWIWIAFRFEAEWSKLTHMGAETRRVRGNSIPALEMTKMKERSVSFTNPKAQIPKQGCKSKGAFVCPDNGRYVAIMDERLDGL